MASLNADRSALYADDWRVETGDDRTRVYDHAPLERRWREVELLPTDGDPGERHRGERRLSRDPAHRRELEARRVLPRTEGKEPRLAA
jgi:hypothetical protein